MQDSARKLVLRHWQTARQLIEYRARAAAAKAAHEKKASFVTSLYDLGWLRGPLNADTKVFHLAYENVNIVAFNADYAEQQTLAFLQDINNLPDDHYGVIITLYEEQTERLRDNPALQKYYKTKKIVILSLDMKSDAAAQWQNLVADAVKYDFPADISIEALMDKAAFLKELATTK